MSMPTFGGMTHRKFTLLVLLASVFTVGLSITLLVVSLPTIAADLDTSVSVMSWTITGPLLSFGVMGPAFGKAGDLWGHRRVFIGGLLLAGVFGLLSAAAWSPLSLIVFRVLSAGFGSATSPSAMAYINRMFEARERVRPLGFWNFTTASSPVVGVVLGAPLVELIGWRTIFLIQGPLCLIAAVVAAKALFETERQPDVRFDVKGSVALGLGSVLLLLAINRGSSWGWLSPEIIGMALAGVLAIIVFLRIESVVSDPLMPLVWLRTRNIVSPIATLGLLNFAYMGSFLIVPQMLQDGLGYSTQRVGWLVIARPLAFSMLAPFSGRLARLVGERRTGMLGGVAIVIAMLALVMVREPGSDALIIFGLAFTGIGLAFASPSLTAVMSASVDNANIGVASALMQLSTQLGAVVGGATMIAIHESTLNLGTMESFGVALSSGAVAAVVAIAVAGLVRNRPN
jgi:MFS family permease